MLLKNTSRYPTDEVRELLAFAAEGLDLAKVAVHVKNTSGAYAGMSCGPKLLERRAHARSLPGATAL